MKKIAIAAAAVIVMVMASAGFAAYRVHSKMNDMTIDMGNAIVKDKYTSTPAPTGEPTPAATEAPPPPDFYALLIGVDSRESLHSLNTDSLMMVHIIPQNHSLKLVSIPRDLKITNADDQYAKINSIFAEGYVHAEHEAEADPSLLSGKMVNIGDMRVHEEYLSSGLVTLKKTIEDYFGVSVRNTFFVNFDSVVSLIDAVGGIEVNVDRDMDYDAAFDNTHIHLKKGVQTLDGQNALYFMRFRQDNRGPAYYSDDFERGERQQQVLSALAGKLSNWNNIAKAMSLLNIVTANVKTDMSETAMASLLTDFYGHFTKSSIESIHLNGYWKSPYVEIKDDDLLQLVQSFTAVNDQPEDANPGIGSQQHASAASIQTPSTGAEAVQ